MIRFVSGGEAVIEALDTNSIRDLGLHGSGARVAVIDTGINSAELDGARPVWRRDFVGANAVTESWREHGTQVANCIRLIAPDCELLDAAVVHPRVTPTKTKAAEAVMAACEAGANVVNISLDFDADGCEPTFGPRMVKWPELPGVIVLENQLNRDTACELCLACWDAVNKGVAVIVAAGNRWGKRTQCPGRAPGVLTVEARWSSPAEYRYFWSSRSWLRRIWEWRIWGNVGRKFGTSFSAGYTTGEIALLLPFVRRHGWLDARDRIIGAGRFRRNLTTPEMLRRLVFEYEYDLKTVISSDLLPNTESKRAVILALAFSALYQNLAGQLRTLDFLRQADPKSLPTEYRTEVVHYLSRLVKQLESLPAEARILFKDQELAALRTEWTVTEHKPR